MDVFAHVLSIQTKRQFYETRDIQGNLLNIALGAPAEADIYASRKKARKQAQSKKPKYLVNIL